VLAIGIMEKKIPYNVCDINERGLIRYLEKYSDTP